MAIDHIASAGCQEIYLSNKCIPVLAELQKEVNVVWRLAEIVKRHNIAVIQGFPGINFIFQGSKQIIFGGQLVLATVNPSHQIFLGDHLAGHRLFFSLSQCKVRGGEATLTQLIVLNDVLTLDDFEVRYRCYVLKLAALLLHLIYYYQGCKGHVITYVGDPNTSEIIRRARRTTR